MSTGSQMVIAGCSRRKAASAAPLPALELYQGGCVPLLRARVGGDPNFRRRVRILSAEHGLITADTPLLPYDRPLDPARAGQLRPMVTRTLRKDWAVTGIPAELLVIGEPLYLSLLTDALGPGMTVAWVPGPSDWQLAADVLDRWGWA